MKTILIHGPSGSGKDTQANLLMSKFGFEIIGTGEMFRKMYSEGDIDAIRARESWSKGFWVPNELTYKMLNKWIKRFDNTKKWLFVSVVRDIDQVPMFDELLDSINRKLDKFIYFELDEATAIERLSLRRVCNNCDQIYHAKFKKEKVDGYCDKCGTMLSQREDDKPHKISQRQKEDERTIKPIIEEYKKRGIYLEIDASPSIEEIHEEVIKLLNL
jgi:adenylate kinase